MKSFIIEQKITPFANQYLVFDTNETGNKKKQIAFAHQKRLAFKEEFFFYTDETKTSIFFSVKAEKALDINGKFAVKDSSGKTVGNLRKVFKSSLIRSTWEILDENETALIIVQEKSPFIAILRRIWGITPILGELPFLFRYNFTFLDAKSKEVVAEYTKTKYFLDHYQLDIHNLELLKKPGLVALIAQAVILDAMQGR